MSSNKKFYDKPSRSVNGKTETESRNKIEHLNRMLKAVRNINQLITHEKDKNKLIKEACRQLVKNRGCRHTWIILFNESNKPDIYAQSGVSKTFSSFIDYLKKGGTPQCVKKALKTDKVIITKDPEKNCKGCPLQENHDNMVRAAVQLNYGSNTLGLLSVCMPEECLNDTEEQYLLKEVASDISFSLNSIDQDRKRIEAEEELKKNEEKLRNIVENSTNLFYSHTPDHKLTYISPGSKNFFDCTPQEAMIKWTRFITDNPVNKKGFELTEKAISTARAQPPYELELKTKKGRKLWVLVNERPVVKNGKTASIVGSLTDITERKKAEEENRKLLLEFSNTLKGLTTHVFRFRKNSKGEYISVLSEGKIAENAGITTDQIKGKSLKEISREQTYNFIKPYYDKAFNGKKTEFESKIAGRYFKTIIYPFVKDGKGRTTEIIGYSEDITNIKNAEKEKAKYEQEMQKALKLESLGVLAGGIAHDFNNLMGGIFGFIELAREKSNDSDVISYLTKSLGTMERARGLTRQLLTFSKGGEPSKHTQPLFPFINESAQFSLSGSSVSFDSDIQENLWLCSFDKSQIGQVIDNIVINARDAMPSGGTFKITAKNVTLDKNEIPGLDGSDYIKLTLSDNGIGMPPKIIDRIFDPFFTTKHHGSGLGLAISYSIISKHGGSLKAASVQGEGSTFTIYLPTFSSSSTRSSLNGNRAAAPDKNGTVLIMDDENVMLDLTSSICESIGYSARCAKNGQEILKVLKEELKAGNKPAAVILDLTIAGGMGGVRTLKKLKKINDDIPVFVSSGYSEDPVISNPSEYGFMDSICKPFRKKDIVELLNKYLNAS